MVPMGPLCSQKSINNSPKPFILAHFCSFSLFLTSLGRQRAIMTHVLCSDMITKLFTVFPSSPAHVMIISRQKVTDFGPKRKSNGFWSKMVILAHFHCF